MTARVEVKSLAIELQRYGIELPRGTVRATWLGDSPELTEELLSLVRSGRKRGSASLLWAIEADAEPVPRAGDIEIVVDHGNAPRFVTRVTAVDIVPFAEVPAQFAAREGEGDGSLEYWRKAHWEFFSRECRRLGREPSDRMPVVCSSFEVLAAVPSSRVGDWAICVGVLMASLGVLGAYVPEVFVAVVSFFQASPMIFVAAVIRVAAGVILWLAARDSRTPIFFRVFGAFIVLGGLLTPVAGAWIGHTVLQMWASYGHAMVRAWGLIATALGVFIIYSVMSKRQSA